MASYHTNPANPRVWLEVSVGGRTGRLQFELFEDVVPKTAANFRALCTGERGVSPTTRVPLHYKGCAFHRVIAGFMAQGGDTTKGDGTGGESIYGTRFADEGFKLRHSVPYLLSMANAGPNTNGSQFFITFAPTDWLDGYHCVFGELLEGESILRQLELSGTRSGTPTSKIVIDECGEVKETVADPTK